MADGIGGGLNGCDSGEVEIGVQNALVIVPDGAGEFPPVRRAGGAEQVDG